MPDVTIVVAIAAVLALVVLNGVLVAAEFAIVRVRRTRLEELAGQGKEQASQAIILVDRVSDYLTTIQVGITAASLGTGWLGEVAFARLFTWLLPPGASPSRALIHGVATSLAFGLVTLLHVVIGEIVPKNLAITNADRFLMALAGPLQLFHRAIQPASRIFMGAAAWIQRCLGHKNALPPPLSAEELKLVLINSHEDGVLTEGEATIILGAFEFADKCAEEIMVVAERVDYISMSRSFDQNMDVARKNMHARLPLCETDIHSVRGIVSMKDLWLFPVEESNAAFERVSRPLTKIPYDMSEEDILRRFKEDKAQIGVVRDAADQKTLGIVTLEDVLECLVGDVREARISGEPPRRGVGADYSATANALRQRGRARA